jgi:hypothetical protein
MLENKIRLCTKGAPKEVVSGLQPLLQTFQNRNLKNTGFVDKMISNVFHDFPFNLNHSLK